MTLTSAKEELLEVLCGTKILYWKKEEYEGFTMNKEVKPWHIFTFLVQANK